MKDHLFLCKKAIGFFNTNSLVHNLIPIELHIIHFYSHFYLSRINNLNLP